MSITRRTLLETGAGALAASTFCQAAFGQAQSGPASTQTAPGAPLPGTPDGGFFRFNVGSIKGVMLHDGVGKRPLDASFVRNAPLAEVQAALTASGLPTDALEIPYTQVLFETGSDVVLIDTGTGGKLSPTAGKLLENMRAAGYAPERVTKVLISHFHGDHIQGLTTKDNKSVFANAEITVPAAEWAFWTDEGEASRAPEGMKAAFLAVQTVLGPRKLEIVRADPGQEVAPGIRMEAAPGHTPGHSTFRVSSGSDQMIVLSDTTNRPELFARNPGWHAVFDMDPKQAEATRRRLYDQISTDRMRISSYHFPFPAHGQVERDGNGYRFVPATA